MMERFNVNDCFLKRMMVMRLTTTMRKNNEMKIATTVAMVEMNIMIMIILMMMVMIMILMMMRMRMRMMRWF